jgi:ABC-type Zn uptake system ZnuABC Zn-binding protein ZnuA
MEIYNSEIQQHEIEIIDLAGLSAIDDFARYSKTVVNGVTITTEKPYYDDAAFSMVDIYDKDPFIWLDPIAMSSMASTIKDWLVNHYPENALTFENNFKTLQAELIRLDAEYQQLKTRTNVKFVSVAPTFGNWQKSYGVQVYPLILSRYGVLPTDNQLAIIEASIKEAGVKYIAYDDSLPEDMLALYEKVKTDLKLTAVELSSVSRLSADDVEKGKDYLTIMYENLTNLENMTD